MIRRALAAFVLVALAAGALAAQEPVIRIRTAGPTQAGELLRAALAQPYTVLLGDQGTVALPRDSTLPRTVVILDGSATVASHVRGNVVVVNGDLFMHPGGVIEGDAVAIGGCVYPSSLATIGGERQCVFDAHYDVRRTGGTYELRWRPIVTAEVPLFALPFPGGLRLPTYSRVDGVVLPWGPHLSPLGGDVEIDPTLTYRSARGALDAHVAARAGVVGPWFAELQGGRATRTNDAWIHSDLLNGFLTLLAGRDARNYYRADYAALRAGHRWESTSSTWRLWAGGQAERGWSARTRSAWSLLDRRDSVEGMRRPNPPIDAGRINSALLGADVTWTAGGVELFGSAEAERSLDSPLGGAFTQGTAELRIAFPTFGTQHLTTEFHAVMSGGDSTPAQRHAYLGGSGTLYTVDLLALGGDRLLYFEGRYDVPLERLRMRFVGPPILSLRYAVGSAGIGTLPELVQNIGVRLTVAPFRADATLDPVSHATEYRVGLGLGR